MKKLLSMIMFFSCMSMNCFGQDVHDKLSNDVDDQMSVLSSIENLSEDDNSNLGDLYDIYAMYEDAYDSDLEEGDDILNIAFILEDDEDGAE